MNDDGDKYEQTVQDFADQVDLVLKKYSNSAFFKLKQYLQDKHFEILLFEELYQSLPLTINLGTEFKNASKYFFT